MFLVQIAFHELHSFMEPASHILVGESGRTGRYNQNPTLHFPLFPLLIFRFSFEINFQCSLQFVHCSRLGDGLLKEPQTYNGYSLLQRNCSPHRTCLMHGKYSSPMRQTETQEHKPTIQKPLGGDILSI